MDRKWLNTALGFFVIAAVLGALLRLAFVMEFDWLHFRKFLHAHSHTAMMGWVDLVLYILLFKNFSSKQDDIRSGSLTFERMIWISVICVVGMLITFPILGYAGWSVFFSSGHLLLSYLILRIIWKSAKGKGFSELLLRTAIIFYFFSTLAVWAVIPYNILPWVKDSFYYMALQFFLHFQFNGWFLMACFAILFKWIESKGISFDKKKARWFWIFIVVSTILTFALAVAWAQPHPIVFLVNSSGAVLQIVALGLFILLIRPISKTLTSKIPLLSRRLLTVAFWCLCIKVIGQSFVVVPYIATIGFTIRNFVVGFIHLILLGIISHFLLSIGFIQGFWLGKSKIVKSGIYLFTTGFILSEFLLIWQGMMFWGAMGFIPMYYEILFFVSALMPIGLFLIWASVVRLKTD